MNRNIKIRQLTNDPYFSFENFMFSNLTRLTTENRNCQICKRDTNVAYVYKDVTYYSHYECLSLYFLYQFFRVTKSSTENSSGPEDTTTSDKEEVDKDEDLTEDENTPSSNTSTKTPTYTSLYSIYGLKVDEIVGKERVDEDGEERVCHSCGIGEVYFKCLVDGCDNYLHVTCSGSGNMVVYTNPMVNLNFYTTLRNKLVDGSLVNQSINSNNTSNNTTTSNITNGIHNHSQTAAKQLLIKDQHEKDLVLDSYLRKNIINVKEKLISYRFLLCYGHINHDVINNIKAYFLYKLMVVHEYKHLHSVINVISSHMATSHNTKPKEEKKEDKRSSTNKSYLYKTQGSNLSPFNPTGSSSFTTMNSGYGSGLSTRNRSELMLDNEKITPEGFVPKREQGMLRREQEIARREEGRRNVLLINNLIYEYNLYRRSHIQRTNKPLNTSNFNVLFQPVTSSSVTTPTGATVLGLRDDEVLERDIRLLLNVNNNVNSVYELKKITLSNEFNIQNILNTMKQLMYPTPTNSTSGGPTGDTSMDVSTPESSTVSTLEHELREKDVYRSVRKRPKFVLVKLYNKFIWMSVTKLTNLSGSKDCIGNNNMNNRDNKYNNNTHNSNQNYNTSELLHNMDVDVRYNGINGTGNMGSKMPQLSDKGLSEDTKLVILDYIALSNLEYVYIKNIVNSMYYYNNNAVLLLLNRALVRMRLTNKVKQQTDNKIGKGHPDVKKEIDNNKENKGKGKVEKDNKNKEKDQDNYKVTQNKEKEEKERKNKDSKDKKEKEENKDEVINLCGYSWDINPPLYKLYKMQQKPKHGSLGNNTPESPVNFIKDLIDKQLGGKEEKEETFVYKQSIALLSALNSINNNIENYKKNIENNIIKDQYKYENLCFNTNFVTFFQNVSTSLHRYNHFKQSIRKSILFYNPENVNNTNIVIDNGNNGGEGSFGLGKLSSSDTISKDRDNKYNKDNNNKEDSVDNNTNNKIIKEEGNKTKVEINNVDNRYNENKEESIEKNEGEKVKISKEYCSVCLLSELSHKHVLLQCQKCYLRVHYKCYHNYLVPLGGTPPPTTTNSSPNTTAANSTVSNRPSSDTNSNTNSSNKDTIGKLGFYCDPCSIEYNQRYETNYNSSICISCLSSGGAMKSVHVPTNTFTMNTVNQASKNLKNKDKGDEEKWIHLICLVFIMPKVICYDFNNLSQWCIPFNYNSMSTCSICGVVGGIQVSCCYNGSCENNNNRISNGTNNIKDDENNNNKYNGLGVLCNGTGYTNTNNNNHLNNTNKDNNNNNNTNKSGSNSNGIQINGVYGSENSRMLGVPEVNMNGNVNEGDNQEKDQSECRCDLKFHPMCCLLSGCYIKYSDKNTLNMNQYHLRTYINNFFNGVFNKETFSTSKEMMGNWEDGILNNLFQSILLEPLCMKHTVQLHGDKFMSEQTVKRCFAYTHYLYNPDGFKSKKKYNSLPIEPIYSPVTITRNGPIKSQPRIMPQHYTKKFSFDPMSKRVKYNEPYLISVIYGLPKNMCGDVPKYGITAITNYLSSAKNNNVNNNNHLNNTNKDNNNKDFKEFKGIHDDKLWYSKHPPQYMVNK